MGASHTDQGRIYRERKYEFGKLLYAYRARLALTQAELAEQIGVHWRTVQNWETGEYYPKADVLQQLIAIFLRAKLFTPGNERTEALAFWQRALEDRSSSLASFDEMWFANVLSSSQEERSGQGENQENSKTQDVLSTVVQSHTTNVSTLVIPTSPRNILLDWGEAKAIPQLEGRDAEISVLRQWILIDRCHVVALLGLGGIGKSSLAISFAHHMTAEQSTVGGFEFVLFRSLQNAPALAQVLDQLIQAISDQQIIPPTVAADKIALLVQLFRQHRCLLILDNYETLFQPGTLTGHYRAGYADYALLLGAMSEREHQSCLMLTSREKPIELGPLEGRHSPVRALRLGGVSNVAARSILQAKGVDGSRAEVDALARLYDGNPLALSLVADPIRSLFGGDIAAFLDTGNVFFGSVTNLMEIQCSRSTHSERSLIFWLAIEREVVPLAKLVANMGINLSQREVLTALESLRRRGQIERAPDRAAFTLQPLILEFVSGQVLRFVLQEIVDGQFHFLLSHSLIQSHARDYVRHSQENLLLTPLLNQLLLHYGDASTVIERLLSLLDGWRGQPWSEQGYGPANVVHLLHLLQGDLRGLNLSQLSLRSVYWQGVEAQDCDLTNAQLRDNVFTETFGVVHRVAASVSGQYWAASSISGTIQVWRDAGQIVHLAIAAHERHVKTMAFSPDEKILATGSWDCTIKLWQSENGAPIHVLRGHQDYVQDIAFSPDGRFLASGSDDQTIRIWEVATGQLNKTIFAHTDKIYGVAWNPTSMTVASCGFDNMVHVWDVVSGECLQTLAGHIRPVIKVAFSPDGGLLVSGGYDRTVRVWDLASGECIKIFSGHESTVMALAWYAEGRSLVTGSYDGTIRLWDLAHDHAQRILLGHRASVNSIAVTVNGTLLLSGSDDETVHVWELASGWSLRVIEGYGLFSICVAWSPDGRSLLTTNSDGTLTLWDVENGLVRQTLHGHTHTVYGTSWSPDGLWLASSGFDQTLRIWDALSGQCIRVTSLSTDLLNRMVKWSPQGQWLAGAGRDRAVRVWDANSGLERWAGRGHEGAVHDVVWSPDGARLASGSDDHKVCIWQAEDGSLLNMLHGHKSSVAGLAWSPDGRYIASCGGGGTVAELFLWDGDSGECVKTLHWDGGLINCLVWSPDSRYLFSGDIAGRIGWWDVASGRNFAVGQGHRNWVRSLAISPDGLHLVSSGEDGVMQLWDVARAELLRTLRLDRPYERMKISGTSGMTTAQRTALIALGATP